MTNEEMLQLLLDKLTTIENKVASNHTELKAEIAKTEARLEAKIAKTEARLEAKMENEIAKVEARLEAKIEAVYNNLLDKIFSLKLVTIHIDSTIDTLIKEFKGNRHFAQGAIHDIQVRQEILETEVSNIKLKLDRAS